MHYDGDRLPEPAAWVPAGDRPDESQQWSGQQAAAPGEAAAYYDVAAGDGRARVLPPSDNEDWPQITANGPAELLDPVRRDTWGFPSEDSVRLPAELLDPVRRDTWGFPSEDSVRLTQRILSDAETQAASVRQEAMKQAGAIREAAEHEAEEIRRQAAYEAHAAREAERKAEELKRRAAEQAEAMREAALREADELRAGAIRLSAELGEVAAYVTSTLSMPAIPAPEQQAKPGTQARNGQYYTEDLDSQAMPAADPASWEPEETWEPEGWEPASPPARPRGRQAARSRLDGRTTTRPAARPDRRPARPATRPARRTDKPPRSRQSRSLRAFAGTITALVLLALGAGAYQLATHGFTFFVFRSAGTGATDNNAIFPGIIPTPTPSPAHHHPTTGPRQHGARRTRHRPKRTAGR